MFASKERHADLPDIGIVFDSWAVGQAEPLLKRPNLIASVLELLGSPLDEAGRRMVSSTLKWMRSFRNDIPPCQESRKRTAIIGGLMNRFT